MKVTNEKLRICKYDFVIAIKNRDIAGSKLKPILLQPINDW